MKLPQGKGEWKRPRKASETIGICTLLRRRCRHIHSTLKVTAITAVMSFSIVRVSQEPLSLVSVELGEVIWKEPVSAFVIAPMPAPASARASLVAFASMSTRYGGTPLPINCPI